MVSGELAIKNLRPGDRTLIAGACAHHSQKDDIGRIKISLWLNNIMRGKLEYSSLTGENFPDEQHDVKILIRRGACMLNREETFYRIKAIFRAGTPVVNYGVFIAYLYNI